MRPLMFAVALAAVCVGCMGQSKPARLQEAAQNLNQATRFGRMDIAAEGVADRAQSEFAKHHFGWGREVRVVDLEFQGMQFTDADNAHVLVGVGWQRFNEQELRVTQIAQKWKYGDKGWKLVEENHAGGDVGLLGERIPVVQAEQRPDAHFRTLTIRGEE